MKTRKNGREGERETKRGKCERERLRSQQQMVELLRVSVDVIFIRLEMSSKLHTSKRKRRLNEQDVHQKLKWEGEEETLMRSNVMKHDHQHVSS